MARQATRNRGLTRRKQESAASGQSRFLNRVAPSLAGTGLANMSRSQGEERRRGLRTQGAAWQRDLREQEANIALADRAQQQEQERFNQGLAFKEERAEVEDRRNKINRIDAAEQRNKDRISRESEFERTQSLTREMSEKRNKAAREAQKLGLDYQQLSEDKKFERTKELEKTGFERTKELGDIGFARTKKLQDDKIRTAIESEGRQFRLELEKLSQQAKLAGLKNSGFNAQKFAQIQGGMVKSINSLRSQLARAKEESKGTLAKELESQIQQATEQLESVTTQANQNQRVLRDQQENIPTVGQDRNRGGFGTGLLRGLGLGGLTGTVPQVAPPTERETAAQAAAAQIHEARDSRRAADLEAQMVKARDSGELNKALWFKKQLDQIRGGR